MANNANVIDPSVLTKGIEVVANATKLAANLTEGSGKKNQQPRNENNYRGGNSTSQPHTQTVEVKVGEQGQDKKPVILKEKNETHIHKPYPENRNLTSEECEVEKLRIKLAFENEEAQRRFLEEKEERERKERREREERLEKDLERRRAEKKKSDRNFAIFAACGVAGMLGLAAYAIYTDTRTSATPRLVISTKRDDNVIPAEGEVK